MSYVRCKYELIRGHDDWFILLYSIAGVFVCEWSTNNLSALAEELDCSILFQEDEEEAEEAILHHADNQGTTRLYEPQKAVHILRQAANLQELERLPNEFDVYDEFDLDTGVTAKEARYRQLPESDM